MEWMEDGMNAEYLDQLLICAWFSLLHWPQVKVTRHARLPAAHPFELYILHGRRYDQVVNSLTSFVQQNPKLKDAQILLGDHLSLLDFWRRMMKKLGATAT